MSKQRNAARAGSFIVVSIVLILAVVVGIKRAGGFFNPSVSRKATFSLKDDIGGLRVGDDVRIGGYKVGIVRRIEVGTRAARAATTAPSMEAVEPAIVVTFSMPLKYELRDDAVIGVQGTLMGQSWLNFESLGEKGSQVPEGGVLAGLPSGVSVAMATLREAAPKISRTLSEVQQLMADARAKTLPLVNETLGKYGKTADTATETVTSFQETAKAGTSLIADVKGYLKPAMDKYHTVGDSAVKMLNELGDMFGTSKSDFKGTLANLNSATGTLKEKLPGWGQKIDEVLQKVNGSLGDASAAIKDIKAITATANSVITGNKAKLDDMIKHLNATALNLELATAEIRSRPWRLLYTPKKGEIDNLVLFDTAREFALGATELNDVAQALRDAMNNPQVDPKKLEELKQKLDASFKSFGEVENKLWEKVRER